MADPNPPQRVDAYLVAGGRFHDIDYARLQLLTLLAEHPQVRVTVGSDYEDIGSITASSFLITYTCDVRPSQAAQLAIADWVANGGRVLALHGSNAALDFDPPNPVKTPAVFPVWTQLLGTRFVAHPPTAPFPVALADPTHWLVAGIEPFETTDELYLFDYHDRESLHALLHTHWQGLARGYEVADWSNCDPEHLVSYTKSHGAGEILYNALGHCRGHWDMPEVTEYYPKVDRCSWEIPQYHELLRRGIRWAMGEIR